MHPYNLKERRTAFIGIQSLVLGIAAYVTYAISQWPISNELYKLSVSFLLEDLLFGILISQIEYVYEVVGTCECVENCGKRSRKLAKSCGHCAMAILVIGGIGFGIMFIALSFYFIGQDYPDVGIGTIMFIFFINYITALVFAWFLLDFTKVWHILCVYIWLVLFKLNLLV